MKTKRIDRMLFVALSVMYLAVCSSCASGSDNSAGSVESEPKAAATITQPAVRSEFKVKEPLVQSAAESESTATATAPAVLPNADPSLSASMYVPAGVIAALHSCLEWNSEAMESMGKGRSPGTLSRKIDGPPIVMFSPRGFSEGRGGDLDENDFVINEWAFPFRDSYGARYALKIYRLDGRSKSFLCGGCSAGGYGNAYNYQSDLLERAAADGSTVGVVQSYRPSVNFIVTIPASKSFKEGRFYSIQTRVQKRPELGGKSYLLDPTPKDLETVIEEIEAIYRDDLQKMGGAR
jgi:hypothetical protein